MPIATVNGTSIADMVALSNTSKYSERLSVAAERKGRAEDLLEQYGPPETFPPP